MTFGLHVKLWGRLSAGLLGCSAFLAAGCASTTPAEPPVVTLGVATPCPGQTEAATWAGVRRWNDGQGGDWTLTFRPDGVLVYAYAAATYDNGRWSQSGANLTFDTNNHYADYTGVISGETVSGAMKNTTGNKGEWSARRKCDG